MKRVPIIPLALTVLLALIWGSSYWRLAMVRAAWWGRSFRANEVGLGVSRGGVALDYIRQNLSYLPPSQRDDFFQPELRVYTYDAQRYGFRDGGFPWRSAGFDYVDLPACDLPGVPNGFAVTVPLYAPMLVLGAWAAVRWVFLHRRAQRKRKGLCLHGGYDLRGGSGRCPECGNLNAVKGVDVR